MEIDNQIESLIRNLGKDYRILEYVYNGNSFVEGATPVYYSGPYWDNREIVEAVKSLLMGKWISSGEKVKEFEHAFAKRINQRFGTMVNSGSSANLIMIASLKKFFGWKDGDEIILSAVGFPTTVSVIPQNGLKPVFADIEMDTLNFDLDRVEEKITPRTRAIFLSPVLGNPPDMDRLITISRIRSIPIILDCCDSLGSKWDGKYLGEYAAASSHSFYPAHTISTGEGGMITTNIREVSNLCKSFSTWGRDCVCSGAENLLPNGICNHRFDKWIEEYDGIIDHKYVFNNMGYNLKPLDLQGAIGLVQLEKLDEIILRKTNSKIAIGSIFNNNVEGVYIPEALPRAETAWFGTPIICFSREIKDHLVKHLEENKIQTRNYFAGNILFHKGYSHLGNPHEYPNSSKVLELVFFVGASPHYTDKVFHYIEKVLDEVH